MVVYQFDMPAVCGIVTSVCLAVTVDAQPYQEQHGRQQDHTPHYTGDNGNQERVRRRSWGQTCVVWCGVCMCVCVGRQIRNGTIQLHIIYKRALYVTYVQK